MAYWSNNYRKFFHSALGLLVLIVCIKATVMLNCTFIEPRAFEYSFLKYKIRTASLKDVRHIHIISPTWQEGISTSVYQDEYGIPSSMKTSVFMTKIALHELENDSLGVSLSSSVAEKMGELPEHTLVIDMRDIKYLR